MKAISATSLGVTHIAPRTAAEKGVAEHFGLLHVLVVDDDQAVRKACCQIARGMGFAVVLGADSATSAREILKHQRIDLLLLDLCFGEHDGLCRFTQ